MKLLGIILLGLMATGALADQAAARKLRTIGPDDVAAAAAVGEAVVNHDIGAKKVAARIAKAKAEELEKVYKADRRVAHAMQHAIKHAGGHAEEAAKLAKGGVMPAALLSGLGTAKFAVHDGKRISHAMARAQRIKAKASAHTVKVVVKAIGEAASSDIQHGAKALAAVSNAALHDAATFVPVLSGLGPQFLPQLAGAAGLGPAGLGDVLGGLASAIGGALMGNTNIGVAGPPLLAARVADLLPTDLLQGLSGLLGGGAGGAGGPSPASIGGMTPEALGTIVQFLAGGAAAGGAAPLQSIPPTFRGEAPFMPNMMPGLPGLPHLPNPLKAVDDIVHLPQHALQALMHSITGLMNGGHNARRGPHIGPFQLPQLPPAGLPLPLKAVSNLLGVLPRPDLRQILQMLPPNPLLNLVGGLPLGLAEQ